MESGGVVGPGVGGNGSVGLGVGVPGTGVGVLVGVIEGVPGPSVGLGDAVVVGMDVPEVGLGVGVVVPITVAPGDGVVVGMILVEEGVTPGIDVAVAPGVWEPGIDGLAKGGGMIGSTPLSMSPKARANGLGWTICSVSRNQAMPASGRFPQPSGPS